MSINKYIINCTRNWVVRFLATLIIFLTTLVRLLSMVVRNLTNLKMFLKIQISRLFPKVKFLILFQFLKDWWLIIIIDNLSFDIQNMSIQHKYIIIMMALSWQSNFSYFLYVYNYLFPFLQDSWLIIIIYHWLSRYAHK